MKPHGSTLDMMRRVLRVRQSIDRRLDRLMTTPEDGRFWSALGLYKWACRLELRLVERCAGRPQDMGFTP